MNNRITLITNSLVEEGNHMHGFSRRTYAGNVSLLLFLLLCAQFLCVQVALSAPTKIVFSFRGGELQAKTVEAWKADFEAKNPDITVEWMIPAADWMTKLPVMVATGTGPDVYESWGVNGTEWGSNGVSLDITPYVKRDFTTKDIQDFYPPAWNATLLTSGPKKGVRFGLPSNGNIFLMFYNKDMFAAAGVPNMDVLDKQGQWTWDTLITVGKKLTRRDGDNRIIQMALDSDDLYAPTNRGSGWLHAAGGAFFDFNTTPIQFTGNQPEAIKALKYEQDLIWTHQLMSPLETRGGVRWNQGKSAIVMWQGSASLGDFEKNNKFDWDLGPKPMGDKSRGYIVSPDMFAINAQTPNKEAAWRFLKYLTSTEGQQIYSRIMGRSPSRRSAFPYFQSLFPKRSTEYITLGMMEGLPTPESFIPAEVNTLILKAVREQIATNKMHPQQAMDGIVDAIKAMLK